MTTIIGFDPGLTGAFAIIAPGRAEVRDLPVMPERRALWGFPLHRFLKAEIDGNPGEHYVFVVEDVRHLGGTAAGGFAMASLMHSKGVIEGVIGALGGAAQLVDAKAWQRMYGIKAMKKDLQEARNRAVALYPDLAGTLARVKDENRVAAVLIAHFGLREFA